MENRQKSSMEPDGKVFKRIFIYAMIFIFIVGMIAIYKKYYGPDAKPILKEEPVNYPN